MQETFCRAFSDRPSPLLSYGIPFTSSLLKHVDSMFHASRIYLICSRSLAKNTTYVDNLKQQLGERLVGTRVGLRPHSLWSEVLEVVADVKQCEVDCLVTLGAGSLTDAAKVVSFAVANSISTPDELESISTNGGSKRPIIKNSEIPIISIPTSLSGGEYSSFAGATNDTDGRKYAFSGPEIKGPSLVILDPELAATTPDSVWLSTGVRALDHCVETLCSLQSNDRADEVASLGLKKLVPGLLRCKKNPNDVKGRLECFLGSRDAMAATISGVPMGASHGIGHQLGPAGVGHGETSCILNPAVCKYNYSKKANIPRQDAIATILWQILEASAIFENKGLEKNSARLGDLMDAIIRALGLPRTLKEFGIGEEKLDAIAESSMHDRWVKTNPAHLDKEGVLEILRMVLQ